MLGLANTWGDIYRGSTDTGSGLTLGDGEPETLPAEQVDNTTQPVAARVPMSIIERSRKVYLEETDELRTIRYGIGRLRGGIDVRKHDRVWDVVKQRWWTVNEISGGGRTTAGLSDLSLDLREV